MDRLEQFLNFAEQAPTAFHATAAFRDMLRQAGFSELKETDPWIVDAGGKYYVVRNDSAIIAFAVPETGFSSVRAQTLPEQPKDVNYKTLRWRLEIPTLDLTTDIVEVPLVDNEYPVTWLGYSAGLLEDSELPGQGRALVTGHNHLNTTEAGPFALLDTLNEGDRIFVTDPAKGMQIFEVYMNTKISEYDFDGLQRISETDEHSLTLITCEDERPEGGYDNRRIIAARPLF